MAESFPEGVTNRDVRWVHEELVKYYTEMVRSQSAGNSGMRQSDVDRALSYVNAIDTYMNWAQSLPELDFPESHPTKRPLSVFPDWVDVDSEAVDALADMFRTLAIENANSQSAKDSNKYKPADEARVRAVLARITSFINDFVTKATPVDTPESLPADPEIVSGSFG